MGCRIRRQIEVKRTPDTNEDRSQAAPHEPQGSATLRVRDPAYGSCVIHCPSTNAGVLLYYSRLGKGGRGLVHSKPLLMVA
jgi:hypothetical protein